MGVSLHGLKSGAVKHHQGTIGQIKLRKAPGFQRNTQAIDRCGNGQRPAVERRTGAVRQLEAIGRAPVGPLHRVEFGIYQGEPGQVGGNHRQALFDQPGRAHRHNGFLPQGFDHDAMARRRRAIGNVKVQAEADFSPGIILYLTYWYPAARRAKVTSLFMTGIPMAGVIGGPLSGWILTAFDGVNGLAGWKWLFILEAAPSIFLGVMVLFYMNDKISDATWLSPEQKAMLQRNIEADGAHIEDHSALGAFRNGKVWILAAAYFGFIMGLYGVSFWLPSLIKASGVTSAVTIGWLVAIAYAGAVACMIWTSGHSDRTGVRRWHIAIPALLGAVGLVASILVPQTPLWAIVTLTLATMGILTGLAQFWCLPPAFLGGAAAAAGIALINSVGNLAGFVSPFIVGWIKDLTGSTNNGLLVIAASLVVGSAIVLSI